MAYLTLRTDADKQTTVYVADGFKDCSATNLRLNGIVYTFTRFDGREVALSFEGKPGVYVVWTLDDEAIGYTTFLSRVQAITHATHCANVVYKLR